MDIFKPILKIVWHFTDISDRKRIASQTEPEGLTQVLDLPYIDDGRREHLLDIYYPEGAKGKLPVIIDIHGGGWMYGYKEINKNYCLTLAQRGFLVASINYRLSGEVRFSEQISDVFASFKWLSQNLSSYPADINNVFLVGDSAGGQFACISSAVNLSREMQKDFGVEPAGFRFNAVGAISPAVDLASFNIMMNANLPSLLGDKYRQSKFYKYMDFTNIASSNLPAYYIVTSSGDFIEKHSYKLSEKLNELGVENVLCDFKEKLHGKKLPHVFSVVNPFSEPAKKAIDGMTNFFKSKIL